MEALSFFKFWKPISSNQKENLSYNGSRDANEVPSLVVCSEGEPEEGDDSFFELELTVSDFDNNHRKQCNRFDSNEGQQPFHFSTKNAGHGELMMSQQQQTAISSMSSSSDVLSKRKILPIEPSSKPQSPIALLKSAPKLKVSIFKKSKSMATAKAEKTETAKRGSKLLTVKFKVEEISNLSVFSRASSLRKTQTRDSADESSSSLSSSYDHSSKRFSKDVIQKYLKLIKPFYVKVSKKNEKMRFSRELSEASPVSSPATLRPQSPKKEKQGNVPSAFRGVSRHLGKSKSASATAALSPARRDDSLLLQHDGIQSAILHCKNSFNSRGTKC